MLLSDKGLGTVCTVTPSGALKHVVGGQFRDALEIVPTGCIHDELLIGHLAQDSDMFN